MATKCGNFGTKLQGGNLLIGSAFLWNVLIRKTAHVGYRPRQKISPKWGSVIVKQVWILEMRQIDRIPCSCINSNQIPILHFKSTTHDVSCFLLIFKWKRRRYEGRRQSFSLSCVFNWKVLLDELSTGSTIIHNLDERKTLALASSRLCTPLRCPSTFTDVYWVTRRSLITHCTDSCGKESGSSSAQPLNLKKRQEKPRTSRFTALQNFGWRSR